jgi:hypothetical protein
MLFRDIDPLFFSTLQKHGADELLRRHQQLLRLEVYLTQTHRYARVNDATQLIRERVIAIEVQLARLASQGRLTTITENTVVAAPVKSWRERIASAVKTDAEKAIA